MGRKIQAPTLEEQARILAELDQAIEHWREAIHQWGPFTYAKDTDRALKVLNEAKLVRANFEIDTNRRAGRRG